MLTSRRQLLRAAGFGVAGLSMTGCGSSSGSGNAVVADRRLDRFTSRLESRIPPLLTTFRVPGLSVALIRDGAHVWSRGFGLARAGEKRRIDQDTVFEVQSMSKPVFAYMVLKLAESGTLDLDAPLTSYASSGFSVDDPRFRRITARHVLSHTSGLPNWRSASEPLAMQFTPGERWRYSGEGYAYLQSVVTHLVGTAAREPCGTYEGGIRVCATDIDAVMRTRVLEPFGMRSSGYVWDQAWASRVAHPHDGSGHPLTKRRAAATDAARYASSGGLHSTTADFARFLFEVIAPKPADAFRLAPASLRSMATPVIAVPDDPARSHWALGWQVFPSPHGPILAHGGNGTGFHAFAGVSTAAGAGFVVMTNGDNGWQVLRELGMGGDMTAWLGIGVT